MLYFPRGYPRQIGGDDVFLDKHGGRQKDSEFNEEIFQGNYYRGVDKNTSILGEHFLDHSLSHPPSVPFDGIHEEHKKKEKKKKR